MNSDDLATLLIGFLLLVFILVEVQGFSAGGAVFSGIPVMISGMGLVLAAILGTVIGAFVGILSLGLPGLIALIILLLLLRTALPSAFTSGNYLVILAFFVFLVLVL